MGELGFPCLMLFGLEVLLKVLVNTYSSSSMKGPIHRWLSLTYLERVYYKAVNY